MSKIVVIKRIILEYVRDHPETFNTNNHYNDENIDQPDDYKYIINRTNTCNWVDLFHKTYYKIILDKTGLMWMKKCYFKIGVLTHKFSHLYDDELEMSCKKYKDKYPSGEWFIRTDKGSLKEGQHGIGPYSDFKSIIESMVTGVLGHNCFNIDDESCAIYFLPWMSLDFDKEFRIFVCDNNITAISDQHCYHVNKWLNSKSNKDINSIITIFL